MVVKDRPVQCVFSTLKGTHFIRGISRIHLGQYLEYIGGCSVYHTDVMIDSCGGYHEYIGDEGVW